jgi:hypothetical protein
VKIRGQHESANAVAVELGELRLDAGSETRGITIAAVQNHPVMRRDRFTQSVGCNVIAQRVEVSPSQTREKSAKRVELDFLHGLPYLWL